MLAWVTVGRYSHLSLRDCLALQKYFVAHVTVNQQTHQMAPVAYTLQQKHLASAGNQTRVALDQSRLTNHYAIQDQFKVGPIIDTDYRYFGSHRLSSDMTIIFR